MPSHRYLDRAVPSWVRALLAALTFSAAVYAVLLVGGAGAVGLPVDPDSWAPLGAFALVSSAVCVTRALRSRRERFAWTLLGIGMTSSGCGYIVWALFYEHQAAPPYPSVSDALWIPYFLMLLAALGALMKSERPHIPATAWLDALIPACAVSAVASQLLLPHVSTAGKPVSQQILLLTYPALDVLLVEIGRASCRERV